MSGNLTPIDKAKFVAAKQASEYVESGMKVGLGTGSTAEWLVQCLGEMVRENGLKIKGVPTSKRTGLLAQKVGIDVITLDEAKWLDVTIDGTDEYDSDLTLIKGGGGAHLREKIVATASERMIVIADASKKVDTLGAFPLPVEVIPFGLPVTQSLIEETLTGMDVMDTDVVLRMKGDAPFVTDEGNFILDLHLKRIGNPRQLSLVSIRSRASWKTVCSSISAIWSLWVTATAASQPAISQTTRPVWSVLMCWMTTISLSISRIDP